MVATSVYPYKGSSGRTAKTVRKGLSVSTTRASTRERFSHYKVVHTREPACGKTVQPSSLYYGFLYGNKLSNVRSFIISRSSGGN